MGFELTYSYYAKNDKGYDMENVHELKKRLGKSYDDTSYEKLASTIMGQFARRDIMVFDVKITEFIKKKVSFRETKNGIVIKNKKYVFDGSEIELQSIPEQIDESPSPVNHHNKVNINHLNGSDNKRPLRHETFDPHKDFVHYVKEKNLKFTIGNKYPIYKEKEDPRGVLFGMLYTTIDDEGNKQILNDKFFVFKSDLIGGNQFDSNNSVDLNYGSGAEQELDMPKLR